MLIAKCDECGTVPADHPASGCSCRKFRQSRKKAKIDREIAARKELLTKLVKSTG